MPDCNLGHDETAIHFILYSMPDLPQVWAKMRQFLHTYLYPVLYAGSTSSLGRDETVSTYTYLYLHTHT